MPRTKVWTARELKLLLRAWKEVPAIAGEGDRSLCVRIHAQFVELCDEATERSENAVHWKRCAMLYNYRFIAKYEKSREPGDKGWFDLSLRTREELFDASGDDQKFMDLNVATYLTIKQIQAQPPIQPHLVAKRKRAEATLSVAPRSLALEWTQGELVCLVRAWGGEMKDTRSNVGGKLRSNHNKRIYERFASACGGTTTRSPAAVATKRQDLASSYEFIVKFNARQQQRKNATWFVMSKIEKLAVLRGIQRWSEHVFDIPEDIFELVGQVIEGPRDSASGSSSSSESDEDDAVVEELASPKPSDYAARKKQKLDAEETARGCGGRFVSKSALRVHQEPRRNANNYPHQLLETAEALSEQAHHLTKLARRMELANEVEMEHAKALKVSRERRVNFEEGDDAGHGSSDRRREAPAQTKVKKSAADGTVTRLQNQGGGHGASWEA